MRNNKSSLSGLILYVAYFFKYSVNKNYIKTADMVWEDKRMIIITSQGRDAHEV